jgi:putative hydrolase of the HAD superfamily
VIKAIIFDFFGVICSDGYWQSIQKDQRLASQFEDLSKSMNLGKIKWEDFIEQVAEKSHQDPVQVHKLFEERQLNPELISYINDLHSKYKTAILSNASREQLERIIANTNIHDAFDEIVVSSDVGAIKPDRRIFELTLQKLQVEPGETVFIDDIDIYVQAAAQFGMKAIQYQTFQQMKSELEKLLSTATDN